MPASLEPNRAEAPTLRQAAIEALAHVEELADAWERGALTEHDGKGGTRSNRNRAVRMLLRATIHGAEKDRGGYDNA